MHSRMGPPPAYLGVWQTRLHRQIRSHVRRAARAQAEGRGGSGAGEAAERAAGVAGGGGVGARKGSRGLYRAAEAEGGGGARRAGDLEVIRVICGPRVTRGASAGRAERRADRAGHPLVARTASRLEATHRTRSRPTPHPTPPPPALPFLIPPTPHPHICAGTVND
jgi:hypothetical protein